MPQLSRFHSDDLSQSSADSSLAADQIRLLVLEPGVISTDISCSLITACLSEDLIYEALSYVWGTSERTHGMWLHGKMFPITANLARALQNIRDPIEPRTLWVDAICINQDDLEERCCQVQLMSRIYGQSRRVLIWFGEEDKDIWAAFEVVERLSLILESYWDLQPSSTPTPSPEIDQREYSEEDLEGRLDDALKQDPTQRSPSSTNTRSIEPYDMSKMTFNLSDTEILCLEKAFLENEWWWRLWCVQEFVYAPEAMIICGHRTLAWETLEPLLSNIRKHIVPSEVDTIMRIFRLAWYISSVQDRLLSNSTHDLGVYGQFSSLFYFLKDHACQDPRDKIYAMLSLSKSAPLFLTPNYSRSTSGVCLDATKFIIHESNKLDILCTYDYINSYERQFISAYEAWRSVGQFFNDNQGPELEEYLQSPSTTMPNFKGDITVEMAEMVAELATHDQENDSIYPEKGSYLSRNEEVILTWLLNLTARAQGNPMTYCGVSSVEYKASGDTFCNSDIFTSNIPSLLILKGIIFDTITYLSDRFLVEKQGSETELSSWKSQISDKFYPTGEDRDTVYMRTLLRDTKIQDGGRITIDDIDHYRSAFLTWSEGRENEDEVDSAEETAELTVSKLKESLRMSVHRQFFCVTEKGYVGLVGGLAKLGDQICIVDGAPVPMVLRYEGRLDAMSIKYLLGNRYKDAEFFSKAGTAYIHGIMDGEATLDERGQAVERQKIHLV